MSNHFTELVRCLQISICLIKIENSDNGDCLLRMYVRIKTDDKMLETPECAKAFVTFYITIYRVASIQGLLTNRPMGLWRHSEEKTKPVYKLFKKKSKPL